MGELQVFNFNGSNVRTLIIENEPYFVGRDVAEVLGYKKPENAVGNHVDSEDKTTTLIQGTGSSYKSKTTIINESGLYSLVLSSKLPQAKEFKRWVTKEVLPTIRKHGMYANEQTLEKMLQDPQTMITTLEHLRDEQAKNKELQEKVNEMQPKALFADAVASSHTSILIGELAKILKGNGINMGQKRLFEWMRQHGYLIKRKGSDRNMPTQKSMDLGLFEIKESTYQNADGSVKITKTPKVTGKGQAYFINKFLKEECEA